MYLRTCSDEKDRQEDRKERRTTGVGPFYLQSIYNTNSVLFMIIPVRTVLYSTPND